MQTISFIFIIVGAVLCVIGVQARVRRGRAFRRINHTSGLITDKQAEETFDDRIPTSSILLTIRYLTSLGDTHEFRVRELTGDAFNVGDEVPVFYDPARPELASMGSPRRISNLFSVSFVVGGVFCILLGFLLFAAYVSVR